MLDDRPGCDKFFGLRASNFRLRAEAVLLRETLESSSGAEYDLGAKLEDRVDVVSLAHQCLQRATFAAMTRATYAVCSCTIARKASITSPRP